MELLQRLDQQVVDREPHRAPPVRVAAEQPRRRTRPARSRSRGRWPPRSRRTGSSACAPRQRADAVGREELVLVEHPGQDPPQPVGARRCDSSRRWPVAGHVERRRCCAHRSGRFLRGTTRIRAAEVGQALEHVRARCVSTANSGISPTDRADPQRRSCSAVDRQHVVEEAVLLVPQRHAVVADVVRGVGDGAGSARRTWWPRPRRPGRARPARAAIASMLRQYIAIQLVASDCSRRAPPGSGAERSNTPMLSRPRKPPSNTLLPVGVLAVDPPA